MKSRMVYKLATPSSNLHHDAIRALRTNLRVIDGQIQDLVFHLRIIFSDEHFITLLRAEGLVSIPSCLVERLK
jgi:hypothetical protein